MFATFLVSKVSGYLAVGMASLVLVLAAALWFTDNRLESTRKDVALLEADIRTAVRANKTVTETLAFCVSVNKINAAQRDNAYLRAEFAAIRADEYETRLNEALDTTYETTDTECRQLTDPLPAVYVRWLCGPEANCADGNGDG